LLKQSIPYRAILRAANAQTALSHGFTAFGPGDEGAMYAVWTHMKTAIANGEVPGRRMQVATRRWLPQECIRFFVILELKFLRCPVRGWSDGARKAVANRPCTAPIGSNITRPRYLLNLTGASIDGNFTDEEAKAIVDEAHRIGKKVAALAIGSDGIAAALRAGVDTVEHGDGLTDALMDEMARKGIYWVPTIPWHVTLPQPRGNWPKMADLQRENFPKAIKKA